MMEPTVREIAATMPSAVRVFEKYKIDYCCGGQRPLAEVCQERGISAEAVMAEVRDSERPGGGRDWSKAGLSEMIAHILSTHHAYLNTELPLIEARMTKVVEKHGPNHSELAPLASVYAELKAELESHCRKEEIILFPYVEQLEETANAGRRASAPPFGSVRNPIRMMEFEHDNAGNALRDMRNLTHGYAVPADACPTYRALYQGLEELERDLHQHIHLENNILFPRAAELEEKLS